MDDTTKLRNALVTAGRLDLLDMLEDVLLDEFQKGYDAGVGDALHEVKGLLG